MRELLDARARVDRLLAAWRSSEELLAATVELGFDRVTAARGLAAELDAWQAEGALEFVWRRDLGLRPEADRAPRKVLVIAARTLPASAMRQLLWARALGAEVTLKPASGQEALGRALCLDEGGDVAGLRCLAPLADARDAVTQAAIAESDAVIALGSDSTIAHLRHVATLAGSRRAFVGYGHRVSAAIVGPTPSMGDLAALAEDLSAWDQSGCLSPRVLWVAGEAALADVVTALSRALAAVTAGLGPLPAGDAHAQRTAFARAVMMGTSARRVGSWVVAIEAAAAPWPEPLARWLSVRPLTEAALSTAAPTLSTLGLGGGCALELPALGHEALRVCELGSMQRPPLDWLQDGYAPLRALLRPN
jgi:hypothetical protein